MNRPGRSGPGTPPGTTPLARAALALYPPSWRARYGDEVHALLEAVSYTHLTLPTKA